MEPRIQYCKTRDGVDIAYFAIGEGPAIVAHTPMGGHTNIRLEWEYPDLRRWYEKLAARHTLIRFDTRGWGMSQREGFDMSIDAIISDGEAVIRRLGLTQYALLSFTNAVPFAILHAARHPEEVSHLIAWQPALVHQEPGERERALRELMERDWVLFTETGAHNTLGWSEGQLAHNWAKYIRQSVSQETMLKAIPIIRTLDPLPYLDGVQAPTLLLSRPASATHSETFMREYAAGLQNASVVLLDGREAAPFLGDSDAVVTAIETFLGDAPFPHEAQRTAASSGGLKTILFTDLASSTALTQRLGDAKAQELVRAHNAIVREALSAHGGTEIKHTGDGIMASFPTASGALECAVAIQRAVGAREDADLQVHIGLNAGEPVAEESDLFGTSVQLARRICDQASAGQVLVSNVVRELAAGKGFLFADIGEVVPKGFEEPVRLYEVRWRD